MFATPHKVLPLPGRFLEVKNGFSLQANLLEGDKSPSIVFILLRSSLNTPVK